MSDRPGGEGGGHAEPPLHRTRSGFWPDWFSFRRFAQAIQQLVSLKDSVTALKADNERIRTELADVQRDQTAQAKQIEILIRFVETAVSERIDIKAENAAYRVLANLRRLPKTEGEP